MNGYLKTQNAALRISLVVQDTARKSAEERYLASVKSIRCEGIV